MRYRTYTLRIEASDDAEPLVDTEALEGALQDAQDAVNDALPDGYYCKIDESGEGVDLEAVRRLEQMTQFRKRP